MKMEHKIATDSKIQVNLVVSTRFISNPKNLILLHLFFFRIYTALLGE